MEVDFPIIKIVFSLITSFIISYLAVPTIIRVARMKSLYDEPNERRAHKHNIPTLGGLAVFAGLILSVTIWTGKLSMPELQYIIAAIIVIFFVGLKDDILVTSPLLKFTGQMFAALILVILGDIRISSLHGFFNIFEINYILSVVLSTFVIVVIINGYNLIDGIDGLAVGVGIVTTATFGIWFLIVKEYDYAILSAGLIGGLFGFLPFNVVGKRNKIFMGDTGSLLVGLIISILVIKFNEMNIDDTLPYHISSAPSVSFGILIIPLFDILRVMFIRIIINRSPFHADKNHIHHRLLELGLKHLQASTIIVSVNILFIAFVFIFQYISIRRLLLLLLLLGMLFSYIPSLIAERKEKASRIKDNSIL